jgi:hypothetical protein
VISDNDLNSWGEHFLAVLTKDAATPPWPERLGLAPPIPARLA